MQVFTLPAFYKWFLLILLTSLVSCSTTQPSVDSILFSSEAAQTNISSAGSSPISPTLTAIPQSTPWQSSRNTDIPSFTVELTKVANDLLVWAEDIRREGDLVKVLVCYELPDHSDWMIDHAFLDYKEGDTSLESTELIELDPPSSDGKKGRRCDEVTFPIPEKVDLSHVSLTVEQLRATPNEGEYCYVYNNEVQPTLDARQTGIKLECNDVDHGYELSVLEKPDSLSQEEAERLVYDFFTISGPWVSQFSEVPDFIFDPLPYSVKPNGSTFLREGDLFKIDLCVQINNNDWEAWQVQEGILQYAGKEDRYFGTTTQLHRISPVNAKIAKYCGILEGFPNLGEIPINAIASDFTLTITSIIPVINNSNLCSTYLEQVQNQLGRRMYGAQVQCGKSITGKYVLQSVNSPKSIRLSKSAWERVLANVRLFTFLQGPWTFDFK